MLSLVHEAAVDLGFVWRLRGRGEMWGYSLKLGTMQWASIYHLRGGEVEQSLEFIAEMRVLAEMKIKNRGKNIFHGEKNRHTFCL